MYTQNIEILLIGLAVSMLSMTLCVFLGSFITTCFEIPEMTRIPQDKWKVGSE